MRLTLDHEPQQPDALLVSGGLRGSSLATPVTTPLPAPCEEAYEGRAALDDSRCLALGDRGSSSQRAVRFPHESVEASRVLGIQLIDSLVVPYLIATPDRAGEEDRAAVRRVVPRWPLKGDKAIAHLIAVEPGPQAEFAVKADAGFADP